MQDKIPAAGIAPLRGGPRILLPAGSDAIPRERGKSSQKTRRRPRPCRGAWAPVRVPCAPLLTGKPFLTSRQLRRTFPVRVVRPPVWRRVGCLPQRAGPAINCSLRMCTSGGERILPPSKIQESGSGGRVTRRQWLSGKQADLGAPLCAMTMAHGAIFFICRLEAKPPVHGWARSGLPRLCGAAVAGDATGPVGAGALVGAARWRGGRGWRQG